MTTTAETEGEPEKVEMFDVSIFVRERTPVGFTLELAVDQESKRRLIARKDNLLVKATGKLEWLPMWR